VNQNRADLLTVIAELSRRYPHWRFGQLVSNVAGWTDKEIWDAKDDELLNAVRQHLDASARESATSPA